jgi:hypothetical protein
LAWSIDSEVDFALSVSTYNLPDSDWSIAIWARNDGALISNEVLFGAVATGAYASVLELNADADEHVNIDITKSGETNTPCTINGTTQVFNDTNWHHICLVRSGTTLTLYVDATSEGTDTLDWASGTWAYQLGLGGQGIGGGWNGDACEFSKWDRALSTAEIASLNKGFSALFYPNSLVSYIPGVRDFVPDFVSGDAVTNSSSSVTDHPPIIYPRTSFVVIAGTAGQTITAPLDSATGLYAPASMDLTLDVTAPLESATGILTNTFTLTFSLNGITQTATLYAPASINEGLSIGGVLQNATGIYVPSIPWDQLVTAPVLTASGQVVASLPWDQQLAGALLQATGTLDTGVWVIDQNIAGQILSATGILDTQAWSIDSTLAGVYITPTGLIAATFTGEQLYTGDFTFETPDSDSFTLETPGSDSFTEE